MGKYEPLGQFLKSQKKERISITFSEIEGIIGSKLPNSKHFRAWWSNNPWNNVMTKEWLDAGYQTEAVNVEEESLVFRKVGPAVGASGRSLENAQLTKGNDAGGRHPGFGFMKGLITIEQDFDLTKPFGAEAWDQGYLGEGRADERKA